MAYSESDLHFILDQLSGIPEISHKRMFGGIGFFLQDKMFAMIGGGVFRLKVDESNLADFENTGMKPFTMGNGKGLPYWTVPLAVFEDSQALTQWAQKSIKVAHKAKK
ncbi:MAG: TfoX/Sxy family protein [Marinoscillum sp.]|uniref:TfoX/Sxy family protein n=1 Tax=Marinoscillum sp. TaxID=2024838 RepID=UPI0032FD0898